MAVDLLLSFAFHAKTDLAAVREALGPDQRLMIDSGAFTAHTTGKQVRLEDYAAYLQHWDGVWDYAMNLDVIGDGDATDVNLRRLHGMGVPVMPIYTASAPIETVDDLAQRAPYMAYGGLVGVPRKLQIPATKVVVERAAAHGCTVHALGQTGPEMFRTTNALSGDSSAVSRAPLNFQLPVYDPRANRLVPLQFGMAKGWREMRPLLRAYGLDAASCISGDVMRDKAHRVPAYRAGCIAVACLGAAMRRGADRPHIYSAITTSEVLVGALQAARDWRTGNLPHPLKTFCKEELWK